VKELAFSSLSSTLAAGVQCVVYIVVLYLLLNPWMAVSLKAQTRDQGVLRSLVNDFFDDLREGKLKSALSHLNSQSPYFLELKDMAARSLSSHSTRQVHVLQTGQIEVQSAAASLAVQLVITPVSPEASSAPLSSLYAERLVHCAKESGEWRIWRIGPTTNELAIMVASEPNSEERRRLLAAEPELATPRLVQAVILLGDGLFQQGRYPGARNFYFIAGEIASVISDKSGMAAAERGTGNTLFYAHDNAEALRVYESSLKLAEEINSQGEMARSLDAIANVYSALRETGKAFDFYRRSLSLVTELGDSEETARILNNIGNLHLAQAQYHAALSSYRKSLGIKLRSGNDSSISIALYNVANTLYAEGRYGEALRTYSDSLERAEKTGRKAGLASIHRGLGDVYYIQGNDSRAALNYTKSLDFSRELGDTTGVIQSLAKLNLIFYLRGDYQRALESAQEALELAGKAGSQTLVAQMLDRTGLAHQALGELQQAIDRFQTSGAIRNDLLDDRGAVWSLLNLAHSYRLAGRYGSAVACLDLGLQKARDRANWDQVMLLLTHISDMQYAAGNYRSSARTADEASDLALRYNSAEIEWQAAALAGRAYFALKEGTSANRRVNRAVRTYEEVKGVGRDGESELWRLEGIHTPYEIAVQLQLRAGNVAGAWSYYEREKASILRNALESGFGQMTELLTTNQRRTEETLSDDMHAAQAEVRFELRRARAPTVRLKQLGHQYLQACRKYAAFEADLSSLHPALNALKDRLQAQQWEQARHSLPRSDAAFVEFMVLQDSVRVFILRRCVGDPSRCKATSEIHTYSVRVQAPELSSLVDKYRTALDNAYGAYEQPAVELYELLLKPATRELDGVRILYVVPDGVLWYLPFAALRRNDGKLLIQQFSISYFPSFATFQQTVFPCGSCVRKTAEGRRASKTVGPTYASASTVRAAKTSRLTEIPSLLALADPEVARRVSEECVLLPAVQNLPPSLGRTDEVNGLAELYGHTRSDVFLGSRASKDALNEYAGKYEVIHIAAPAVLDDRNPMHSIILLSSGNGDGDLLETDEIPRLKPRNGAAVLSAAEIVYTNSSDHRAYGQSLITLHRAWMLTGRPQLILSRWITDAGSASAFFLEFHRALIHGGVRHSSDALRSAQLKMLSGSTFQDPFYWAGFMAIGSE
jgi:CHAT domain-containing protein